MDGPVSARARYFDGETARPHEVVCELSEDALVFTSEGVSHAWPFAELRTPARAPGEATLILSLRRGPGPRLHVEDPERGFAKMLAQRAKRLRRKGPSFWLDAGRAVVFSVCTVVSVALLIEALPRAGRLAVELVPASIETRIGERIYSRIEHSSVFAGVSCVGRPNYAEAQAVLDALAAEIHATAPSPFELTIEIRATSAPNAFALPGGRIVILDAILDDMNGPDALAGVLAHEIGHVRERHSLASLVSRMGLAASLAIVTGGGSDSTGALIATSVASLSHSRHAESEADQFAINAMRTLGIALEPTADLFDSFADEAGAVGGAATVLSTHPDPRARAETIRAAATEYRPTRPSMSPDDWRAITSACDLTVNGATDDAAKIPAGTEAPRSDG